MVFEVNLDTLHNNYPDLYYNIVHYDGIEKVYVEKALRQGMYIGIERDDMIHTIGSLYDPIHEAERFCGQYKMDIEQISVVIYGFGMGYIAEETIAKEDICKECIVYEPSIDLFVSALKSRDLTSIISNSHLKLFVGCEQKASFINYIHERMDFHNWRDFYFYSISGYTILFPDNSMDIEEQYRLTLKHKQVDYNTLVRFSKISTENEIKFFKCLPNCKNLYGIKNYIPVDVPCIIVAAGPSLEKNVELLNKAKGKAFIFCVDRAAKYVINHGIIPDMICTIDANKETSLLDDNRIQDIPIAITTTSNFRLFDKFENPSLMCFSSQSMIHERVFKLLGQEMECLHGGGSVALSEFMLATELGFHTIILIGQDLAVGTEYAHAGGEDDQEDKDKNADIQVEGYYGKPVYTRNDFKTYIEVYEQQIAKLKDCVVINATEGGAKIRGTIQMPLKDAIDMYCKKEFDFHEINQKIPYMINTEQEKDEVSQILIHHVEGLRILRLKIRHALERSEQALNHIEIGKMRMRELEQVNQNNNEVLDMVRQSEASDMLYGCMIRTEETITDMIGDDNADPIEEIKNLYRAMIDYMTELKDVIEFLLNTWDSVLGEFGTELIV